MASIKQQVSVLLLLLLAKTSIASYECQAGLKTPETYDGGIQEHGLMYLDRQSVNCKEKGVLKQYQMLRGASGGTIYYNYTCCQGSWVNPAEPKTFVTNWQENAYDILTIDRNSISCPDGMGLQGFFLERGTNHNHPDRFWRYNVSCLPAKSISCYSKELPKQDLGNHDESDSKHIYYLDRHNVDCANDASFLKSSSMKTTYGKKCGSYDPDLGPKCWDTYQLQYTITCCTAQSEENALEYDNAVVQLVNIDRKECLGIVTDSNGGGGARLFACNTPSSGYTTNTFYVESGYLASKNQHVLKLHPYLGNGVVMDHIIADDQYEQVLLRLNASGVVYQSSSNLIYFPESNHKLASSNGKWDPTAIRATSGFDDNYSYKWKLVKQPSPMIVNNLGDVCSAATLSKLNWKQKNCPFATPVVGTGSKKYEATARVVAPDDLDKMTLVKQVQFFIRNKGLSNASIAAMKFYYNEGDPVWSPQSADAPSLPSASCFLAENEYITKAKIIPQTSGPVPMRGVQGVIWETNLKKKCKVPENVDETTVGAFPELSDDSIGSGILYGAVVSLGDDRNIGLLGLLFYDTITGILNTPTWSLAAARNALTQAPTQVSSATCVNKDGTGSPKCLLTYQMSVQDQVTVTNAYQTTTTHAYQYSKKFNFKQAVKTGLKFKAGKLLIKAESSLDTTLETGQEWSMTDTWTNSQATTKTEAKATTTSKTITCTFSPGVPFGHSVMVSGLQTSGHFSIPYKGNFSYQLKSGATFTFPSAGEFTSSLQTECSFRPEYTPPLPPSVTEQNCNNPPPPPTSRPPPPLPSPANAPSPTPANAQSPSVAVAPAKASIDIPSIAKRSSIQAPCFLPKCPSKNSCMRMVQGTMKQACSCGKDYYCLYNGGDKSDPGSYKCVGPLHKQKVISVPGKPVKTHKRKP